MSDLVLARNCCLARMLPGEADEQVCQGGQKVKSDLSGPNGLDTALYKNYLFFYVYLFFFFFLHTGQTIS